MKTNFARNILLLVFLIPLAAAPASGSFPSTHVEGLAEKFIRTELYFGLNKPDESALTGAEWSDFVDEVIAPRFPDGFTVVDGRGQWKNKEGRITREDTKVFIVVYSRKGRRAVGRKIDEIRHEYKKRFDQESVLRVDMTKSVLVSF